jgi:hypothetical protein
MKKGGPPERADEGERTPRERVRCVGPDEDLLPLVAVAAAVLIERIDRFRSGSRRRALDPKRNRTIR